MDVRIFIGDIDEFKCDSVSGDNLRWAVWMVDHEVSMEKLLGRFDTEAEAVKYAEDYRVGPGKNKIIVP
jgi:hypothetical protein